MLGGPQIKHGSNSPLPPHPHQGLALIRQEAHSSQAFPGAQGAAGGALKGEGS